MTKRSTIFACTRCGTQYPAWQGRCTECQAWGTVIEETTQVHPRSSLSRQSAAQPVVLAEVQGRDHAYRPTGVGEFDRVLSGGLVDGSLTLLGGNPGIGKSTLVLQVAAGVATGGPVLYISGEESQEQLKLRYDRLRIASKNILVLPETDVAAIAATIAERKPSLAIVDSIQTMTHPDAPGEAGGVTQIKAATVRLLETAKRTGVPVILVGHVTKEGVVAGPKMLEHLVDTVLYLEGDETQSFRLLRTVKHRFGVTDEVGVFAMTENGLEGVTNPSQLFLVQQPKPTPGNVVTAVLEGSRPFLVEVQALVSPTAFGYPRRLASGFDVRRVELLIAVLVKRAALKLQNQDVHVNLVGGLRVREPATDLAIAMAIASGLLDKPLRDGTVVLGEIGLGGELRPVPRLEQRLHEAAKLGLTQAIIPVGNAPKNRGLTVHAVTTIQQAIELLGKTR